jgi:DNA excision repair protein ERCC-8
MWDTNLLEVRSFGYWSLSYPDCVQTCHLLTFAPKVAHSFYLGGSIVTSIDQSHIATAHSLVAAAVAEPNVHLCDVRAARAAQVLLGHKDSVTVVRWSPTDEHALVSGSLDGTVRMWDVRRPGWLMMYDMHLHYKDKSRSTGFHFVEKKARVARAHEGGVIGLQFTPDGRYLVTTGTENIMRLWETDTGVNTLVRMADQFSNYNHSN